MEITKIFKMTYKGVAMLATLALVSGFLFAYFEEKPLTESFYWALITLTTVGYGDISPGGMEARVISIILACSSGEKLK